ncbi:MAG: apolipoprotein N-acyltransferase [Flavobacteriales bacterium]|nr:apolipoprotein N-acyltransferase [Flavobacteriales bacterium]
MRTYVHVFLSLMGGGLMTLAWPATGSIASLAFVGFVPFLLVVEDRWGLGNKPWRRGVAWVLLPGLFLWNMITTTWLGNVEEAWPTRFLTGFLVMLANSALMLLPFAFMRPVRRTFGALPGWFAFVDAWLCFEHLHMDWDLTWPWLTLGNVFATEPQWVQWYEYTGHLGGSLWVLLVNLSMLGLLVPRAWSFGTPWMAIACLLVPLSVSLWRYHSYAPQGHEVQVVVVQPNIDPYSEKFLSADPIEQLDRMLALAEPLMTEAVKVVVMPETALQERPQVDIDRDGAVSVAGLWEGRMDRSRSVSRIKEWLRAYPNATVLTGMSAYKLYDKTDDYPVSARPLRGTDRHFDASNSALFVNELGEVGVYRKSKLVAGVELLPFEEFLGSIEALSIDLGGTTGSLAIQEERSVFTAVDGSVRVAPVICYESVFGAYVGGYVRNGAGLIAVLTNDGWWGDTPGYKQHKEYARLRAIEHRRDVLRSANTGISCVIDQRGDVSQATGWWEPAAFLATVRINSELTFFSRHGQYLGYLALLASFLCLMAVLVARWMGTIGRYHGPARTEAES